MGDNFVKQITDELSPIFRHMLPGLAILGAAVVSHPSWFPPWSTLADGWHVAILGAIALTVGNVWYVVHRYVLHQFVDYVLFAWEGSDWKFKSYETWLGNHIDQNFHIANEEAPLRNHVHFRSAQLIFLFIIAEGIIIFSIKPDAGTYFDRHRYLPLGAGIVLFLWCTFVQYPLAHSVDILVTNRYGQRPEAWKGQHMPNP